MTAENTPVRPTRCWFCNRPLFYLEQPGFEPEVRVEVQNYSKEPVARESFYAHVPCWNAAMKPQREE